MARKKTRTTKTREVYKMNQVSEFKNKELAFLHYDRQMHPLRGYTITNSQNLEELKKILKITYNKYNTYVTIAKYDPLPWLTLNPKIHWEEFKDWVKIRDQTITAIDFILDFDSEPSIDGLTKAWEDTKTAKLLLKEILGEQTKYLTTWFSGNKGFHILGKTKVTTTPQNNIETQLKIATQIKPLCQTLDTTIYDTARLRKLLGSKVYSHTFEETRVIPIANDTEFKALITALNDKPNNKKKYFQSKQLTRLNNINITVI